MATANRKNHFKIVLLGEGCVGKTSLVLRYCQDKFNDKHLTTLQVHILFYFQNLKISLQLFNFFIQYFFCFKFFENEVGI